MGRPAVSHLERWGHHSGVWASSVTNIRSTPLLLTAIAFAGSGGWLRLGIFLVIVFSPEWEYEGVADVKPVAIISPVYSLFVTNEAQDRSQGTFNVDLDRYLEYTKESISVQLSKLSAEAIDCIKSWPCLLMQEGRGQEQAHIVTITDVESKGSAIAITCVPSGQSAVTNDMLWKLRDNLDIGQFEFNRHHLAIKNPELFATLASNGMTVLPHVAAQYSNKPLPLPSRQSLLAAKEAFATLGHNDIDDFVLEAGVSGLMAGRDLSGRKERANAILKYILDNPTAVTAENSLLSLLFLRRSPGQVSTVKSVDI